MFTKLFSFYTLCRKMHGLANPPPAWRFNAQIGERGRPTYGERGDRRIRDCDGHATIGRKHGAGFRCGNDRRRSDETGSGGDGCIREPRPGPGRRGRDRARLVDLQAREREGAGGACGRGHRPRQCREQGGQEHPQDLRHAARPDAGADGRRHGGAAGTRPGQIRQAGRRGLRGLSRRPTRPRLRSTRP